MVLTYLGMLFGFTGMIFTMEGTYRQAVLCLMFAGICDMFDGTIAATRQRDVREKRFGIQIDSLSDLICFGVLPALFGYMASRKTYLGFLAGCLYVLCALIRLAYFNVLEEERQQTETGSRSCYLGLPVTSAALLLPAFLMIGKQLSLGLSRLVPLLLIGMAAAFVLPLRVKKPKLFGKIGIVFTGTGYGNMKKETLMIRFLYRTIPGRAVLKPLVRPTVSRKVGRFLDSRFSRWLVPLFIKKHHIDMKEYEGRVYRSFNDFFTRKRGMERIDITPMHLISPCDGYLSVYPVAEDLTYRIKHVDYSLERLFKSRDLAEQYAGGTCLIFRLTPQDYHRYCYVCEGVRGESEVIDGCLHCVRPAAYSSVPVFVENSREYIVLSTPAFGSVVQMEVGALLVGKIHNFRSNRRVFQGQEKGYFEFGGSTILVLVKKNRLELSENVVKQTRNGKEMRICLGETVGAAESVSAGHPLRDYLHGTEGFPDMKK